MIYPSFILFCSIFAEQPCKTDVCAVFVIDGSYSIGSDLFVEAIAFVDNVADVVFENALSAALGALTYSDGAYYQVPMTNIPSQFHTDMSTFSWLGNDTQTDDALMLATSHLVDNA